MYNIFLEINEMKNYLFLELDSSECNLQGLLNECAQFRQIHFYLHDFEINKKILDILIPQLNKELFLYCFSENEYLYALRNNIVPHLCWSNESIQVNSWIDRLLASQKNKIINNEFFWMIEESFIHKLSDYEIFNISQKLQFYNIPVCFNISQFFNRKNTNFIDIQRFIQKIHFNFKNPLYLKEYNNIYYTQGNYCLNNNLELKPILMGFFGDVINTESKVDLINLKNMNKNKECINCELYENCTTNKIGYFMDNYNTIKCWGPKLMSVNVPVII